MGPLPGAPEPRESRMAAPSLSSPKPPAPKKPTRKDFDEYCQTREARLQHDRESAALARREKELTEAFKAYAIAEGGRQRTVECCGHRVSVTSVPGAVPWLAEFTKLAGQDAVNELKKNAPLRDSVKVEKL